MHILVVNAGSSSFKLSILDDSDRPLTSETISAPAGRVDDSALRAAVTGHGSIDAVGHRIVHGGTEFTQPVLVDAAVRRRLEALTDLAPLHQPKSLRGLELVSRLLPGVPAVACFDTAFHAHIPAAAATYALPAEWRHRWDLRRFGFHGLSHAYASRRAAELTGRDLKELRIVTCHLGAGASLAAVQGGTSVDTTMGFTPLEGLVMATRSGSVDPGLLLWLEDHVGMPPTELATTLEHRSGLLGLCGSDDMRVILQAEADGDPDSALAVDVFLHRLRGGIAAMAAAMDGLETLVFTGGVGEHAAAIRSRAAEGLGFLGVGLDGAANERDGGDREIGAADAAVRTVVVEAREDVEIARGVRQVLAGAAGPEPR
jgi:acetate kinase